jgi:hypothetical protein
MSSPQFTALRPVPANLVLPKALLYRDRKLRELAFFIQAMSLYPGGLTGMAAQLVAMFPERCRKEESKRASELRLKSFIAAHGEDENLETERYSFQAQTTELLAEFLAELILNPDISLAQIKAPCFDQLGDALIEFKRRHEESVMRDFVLTEAGKLVMETLDQSLSMSRMVVVEGNAGAGKSTNARAWCAARPGLARYISLSGITNRTSFFQKIGAALGFAASGRKAMELQSRAEEFFARSKMMLVIDEAHYLFPQTMRVASSPELIDWIDTALVNQGVPVALFCTDQFAKLKNRVERQTGWTSEQFMHRVFRYRKIEEKPPLADVEAVTRRLLSCAWDHSSQAWLPTTRACSEVAVEALSKYAHAQSIPLAVAASCVDEARLNAQKARRLVVTQSDIFTALDEGQIPSDTALVRAFRPVSAERRTRASFGHGASANKPSKAYVSTSTKAGEDLYERDDKQSVLGHLESREPAPALV